MSPNIINTKRSKIFKSFTRPISYYPNSHVLLKNYFKQGSIQYDGNMLNESIMAQQQMSEQHNKINISSKTSYQVFPDTLLVIGLIHVSQLSAFPGPQWNYWRIHSVHVSFHSIAFSHQTITSYISRCQQNTMDFNRQHTCSRGIQNQIFQKNTPEFRKHIVYLLLTSN